MSTPDQPHPRTALRSQLLSARRAWAQTPAALVAQQALHARLLDVLALLEPQCLGLYWPVKGEFNPRDAALATQTHMACQLALPFVHRQPAAMHYRPWHGEAPDALDECGLPSPGGEHAVQPDVLLVPCLGFTPEGFRLGYGGGYFDRYLAAHPEVTAIGLAWDANLLDAQTMVVQTHDIALMAVLTPSKAWG